MSDKAYKYVHVMNKPNDTNYFTENFANVNIGDYVGIVSATITNIAYSGYILYEIEKIKDDETIIRKGIFQPSSYKDANIVLYELKSFFESTFPGITVQITIEKDYLAFAITSLENYTIKNFEISQDLEKLLGISTSKPEPNYSAQCLLYYRSHVYPKIFINEVRIICDMSQFNERVYLDNEQLLSTNCLAVLSKSNEFKYQCFYLSHLSRINKDPGNIKFELLDENNNPVIGLSVSIELAFFHKSLHTKRRIIIPNIQFNKDYMLNVEAKEIAPFFTTSSLINNVIEKQNSFVYVGSGINPTAYIKYLPDYTYGKLFDLSLISYYSMTVSAVYAELEPIKFYVEDNNFVIRFPKENTIDETHFNIYFGSLTRNLIGIKWITIYKEKIETKPSSIYKNDNTYMYAYMPLDMNNFRYLNETYILKLANIYNDENVVALFSASPDKNDVINNYYYCFRKMLRNNKIRFELYRRYTDDNGNHVEKKMENNSNYRINLWCYIK